MSLSNSNRRPVSFNKTPLNGNCTTLYLLHNNSADQSSCSMDHLMSYFHPWCLFPDHREIVKRICVISSLTTWISSFMFLLHLKLAESYIIIYQIELVFMLVSRHANSRQALFKTTAKLCLWYLVSNSNFKSRNGTRLGISGFLQTRRSHSSQR